MRKFLLSAVALLMTATMLAVGNGSGSSQANAIDFDWDGTYIQEANNTSWHCIKLSNLNKEAEDPTVALYLTNLANETANVELSGSAVLKFPFPISLVVKDIDLLQYVGDDATETYSIEGKKHVVWTMPTTYDLSAIDEGQAKDALSELFGDLTNVSLIQLVEYGLSNVYLRVSSDKQIAIAADVYETAEIVDDACTKAVDFNWAGETVEAGETWFYLDLNAVKNSDKKLNFVVENNGAVEANVNFDLYADCPASAILLDYDWAIAAGSEVKEALGRFFLDQMTRDYVYLKLTTDQAVTLKAEEEVLPPPVELFNPSAAPVLEVGKEYVLNDETVLKVDLAALKAPKGYKTVCHIVNANGVAVNLKQEIAFSTPVTSNNVQEKNLLVEAGAALEINVPNKQVESVKSNVAYFRLTTDESLTLWMEHVKLETSKPVDPSAPSTPAILAPSCEDSYAFDWNSSIKQKALMTKWYELDIAPLKKNKEHVQLAFTNHTDAMVLVFGSILLDCNSKDTIQFVCPVPAGTPINKVLDYSLLAASPLQKAYVSLTMVPTKVKNLSDLASIRSKADVMNLIALDFGAEIEVKAKRISALVDPTACLNYQNLENGVEYTQEAGVTKWYRVTDEFVKNNLGLLEKFTIINQGSKDANVAFGVTVDCKCGIATTIDQKIPRWFDISTYSPTGLFRLVDAVVADEITEFYVSVKSDQPLLFGFDLDYGTTLGCDSAIVFDWEKGAVINSRDAQWYNFDLNTVKGSGSHLKLTFTNHSDEIVWVASAVSLTCPLKVVMPTVVPVLPGTNVDKVIDYSFVATNPINNVYVAVITEGKIELGATLIDATVEEPVDCVNHTEVESGVKYIHKAGTTWYKFSNDLLADMGRAPRFTFENLSSNAISFSAGMTVDCKYGILTKVNAKIPAHVLGQHLHNREFSVRIPREFFQAVRKLIDSDVTELLFQLTANNPFAFSIDMQAEDGCQDAQDFNWADCFDLQANQDKWFKVNVQEPLNSKTPISVALYNYNDFDVTIEAEVSPTCPVMLTMTESYKLEAGDSLIVSFKPEKIKELMNQYSAYVQDMACYARFRANGDIKVCVNANYTPVVPEQDPCDTVDPLNWNGTISLKSLVEGKLYKLDIASLHTLSEASKKRGIALTINNDVEEGVTLITEVYADCMDAAPISGSYSEVTFNELGDTTTRVPYAKFESLGLTTEQTEMYLKVVDLKTKDDPDPDQPCDATHVTDKAICAGESFEWRGNTYTEADTYTEKEVLSCGTVTHVLNLVVNPTPNTPIVTDKAICEGESFVWRGKSYSQADTYTETEELNCGTVTYVLNLVVNPTPNTPIVTDKAICEGESFVWRGKSYSKADTYTETEELSCGTVTYVLNLVVNPTPNTPIVTDKAICEGESFVWRGKSYSKADTYTETEELSCGTVTYVLNLVVNPTPNTPIVTDKAICEGESFVWRGKSYSKADTYTETEELNCGTVTYVLNLVVNPTPNTPIVTDKAICEGESFVWRGKSYSKADTYTETEELSCGTVTYVLNLVVNPTPNTPIVTDKAICEGESFVWRGKSYSKADTYTETEELNCGTVTYVLNLVVNPTPNTPIVTDKAICEGESFVWRGKSYSKADTYTETEELSCGTVTYVLNLVVNPTPNTPIVTDKAICEGESFVWRGKSYSKADTYTETEELSCGTVTYVLNLVVNPTPNTPIVTDKAICEGESFVWRGKSYSKADTYTETEELNCGTVTYVLNLVVNPTPNTPIVTDKAICEGESFVWRGKSYSKADTYTETEELSCGTVTYVLSLTYDNTLCEDPCANVKELDWKAGLKLSDFSAKTWYKMYVGDVKGSNMTVNFVNDESCAATLTVAVLSECLSTTNWEDIAWESLVTRTETCALGLDTTRTVSSAIFNKYPQIDDYVYVYVESKVQDCDPCANVKELDWKAGLKLSDFSAKTWYKMYVGDVKGSNMTVNFVNDESCAATLTAAVLSECLSTTNWEDIAWESLVTRTETCALGLDTTRTVSSAIFNKYPQIDDYVYVYVESKVQDCDPCANVKELDWKAGLKLSDFSAKTWYKMYVGDVKGSNMTVNFVNDESCAATLTAAVLSECLSTTNWEEIEWESLVTRTETCALGLDTTRTVSSAIFNKYPQIDDYVYVYVESKVQDCDPCANVKELDWKAGLKLSDFSAKTWYKMYVGDVKGSNLTVNFVNDESCAATLTVAVLSECLSTTNWEDIAWESLVTRTETCALGLDTTRTVSSAIFDKYPQVKDYVYVYVESKVKDCEEEPEDPCANVKELPWKEGLKLSDFSAKTWYKMYVGDVKGSNLTVNFVNDESCAATLTVAVLSECLSTTNWEDIAWESLVTRTETCALGLDTTRTVSSAIFNKYPQIDDYVYVYVESKVQDCDPCANVKELPWKEGLKLSDFSAKTWYKMYVGDVKGSNLTVNFINDESCAATLTAAVLSECLSTTNWEDIAWESLVTRTETCALGLDTTRTVSSAIFNKYPQIDDYVYVYVESKETEKHTGYAVIKDTICDGATYVDPITNEGHVIASYEPFTLTWTSTKSVSPCVDSVYTFEITPIVAPETITVAFLEEIGAMPKLEAGKKVDVSGTLETIQAYYDTHTSATVAPVTKVYWTAGHEDLLDCDQTSHSMSLVVEAGCGFEVPATLTFDVTSNVTYGTTTATICESELPYTWYEHTLTEAGTATTTLVNAAGCDSIVTLTLVVNKPTYGTTTATICESELPYTWYEHTLTEAGTATTTLVNAAGCDSIVTLTLVVNKPTYGTTTATICESELPYTWYEHTLTEAGTATTTLVNAAGCDSIVTLTLVVNKPTYGTTTATICESELPYTWYEHTLTEAGTATTTLVNAAGCDSIVTLTLVVNKVTYGTTTATICESELPYTWYEHTLTEAGTATTTLVNAAGCDSIVTLTLVVNKVTYGTTTATICESELPYTWYEHTLTEAGTATTTLVNAAGCDSIVTLTLVVNEATYGDTTATVCATKLPYTWYEHTLTETGTATHTLVNAAGCDSIVTLHLTVEGQTPESDPATAPAKAVAKYGNRMILLHVNDFVAVNAWKPASDQVKWYQVVGELDNSWDALAGNGPDADELLGSGLYIENLEGYTGQVYALIVESVEGESCGDVFRTEVLTLTPPAQAPQLVPTIASPNADLRLLNLNPSAVTEIRVYNTTGDLQAVHTASEVADFMFKAATTSGYYMVEVQSDGEKVTLRYIVK